MLQLSIIIRCYYSPRSRCYLDFTIIPILEFIVTHSHFPEEIMQRGFFHRSLFQSQLNICLQPWLQYWWVNNNQHGMRSLSHSLHIAASKNHWIEVVGSIVAVALLSCYLLYEALLCVIGFFHNITFELAILSLPVYPICCTCALLTTINICAI